MKLFSYWRSLASFRVRIALNLKGVPCDIETIDLLEGDQFRDSYLAVNPQPVVPTLVDGGTALFQSLAIVEYLDETCPQPPLLPADPTGRARVRGIAQIASSDSHPLIVPRIRKYLTEDLELSDEQLAAWIRNWMGAGLAAMEAHLAAGSDTVLFATATGPVLPISAWCRRSSAAACSAVGWIRIRRRCGSSRPAWRSMRSPTRIRRNSPTSPRTPRR